MIVFFTTRVLGMILAFIGLILLFLFKFYLVNPAFTKLPNGNYGELYGPISFFRIPVYILLCILLIIGIYFAFKPATQKNNKSNEINQTIQK